MLFLWHFLSLFVSLTAANKVIVTAPCSIPLNTIQTEPVLIENTLARNFNGLKLSIKFLLIGGSYHWSHPILYPRTQTPIYSDFARCVENAEKGFEFICQKVSCEKSIYMISSLTLMFPLDKNVTFAVVRSGTSPATLAFIDIKVKECRISPGRLLEVVSKSCNYNAVGEFRCPQNQYVAYSNKTRVFSNKTKCLATAQWKDSDLFQCWTSCSIGSGRSLEVVSRSSDYNAVGEFRCSHNGSLYYSNKTKVVSNKTKCLDQWEDSDVIQCWTAPSNVFVTGNLNVTEGDSISLKCEHQSSFPASNGSVFFVDGSRTYVEENGTFIISRLQKAKHNQSVFCQVQSPYVELVDPLSGRSQKHFINVLFRPYVTSPQQCSWVTNAVGLCNISFQSNPNAQFKSVIFNELCYSGTDVTYLNDANNLVHSSTTQQYFIFMRDQVNSNSSGFYELILHSNGFGETNISFQIYVVDQLPLKKQYTTSAMSQPTPFNSFIITICLSIAVVFSIISVILLIVYWRERYF